MAPSTEDSRVTAIGELLERMVGTSLWQIENAKAEVTMRFARPPKARDVFEEQCREIRDLQKLHGVLS
jgi:hypothetical protein